MRRLRVLHVTHPDCLPPETDEGYSYKEIMRWKTDFDVVKALRTLTLPSFAPSVFPIISIG